MEEAAAPARWRSSIAWRVSATGVGGGWEGGGGGCIDDCDGGGGQSSDMMVWQLCGISDGGEGGIFFCLSRQSVSARKRFFLRKNAPFVLINSGRYKKENPERTSVLSVAGAKGLEVPQCSVLSAHATKILKYACIILR